MYTQGTVKISNINTNAGPAANKGTYRLYTSFTSYDNTAENCADQTITIETLLNLWYNALFPISEPTVNNGYTTIPNDITETTLNSGYTAMRNSITEPTHNNWYKAINILLNSNVMMGIQKHL